MQAVGGRYPRAFVLAGSVVIYNPLPVLIQVGTAPVGAVLAVRALFAVCAVLAVCSVRPLERGQPLALSSLKPVFNGYFIGAVPVRAVRPLFTVFAVDTVSSILAVLTVRPLEGGQPLAFGSLKPVFNGYFIGAVPVSSPAVS